MSEVVETKTEVDFTESPQPQNPKRLSGKNSFSKNIPFYLILLPAVITVFMMQYLPMFGLLIAFKDYSAKAGIFGSPWADMGGFANFVTIFETPKFMDAVWNTLWLNVLSLVFSFPAPVILALLINEVGHTGFKRTVQTISYLPHFLSVAAVTMMVNQLLDEYGLLNAILKPLGLEPVYLLKDADAFVPTYVITEIWRTVGWGTIVYLATITGINSDLYEAAQIDGANRFQQVTKITLPSILPTTMILLIMKMGTLLGSSFEMVYGLQTTAWKDEVIATAIYKFGINQSEYGLSTALGLMQGVIAFSLTFIANTISKKVANISMW
ncbi:MAG: sugar ABC transporter permease [Clostridia bacterium]|nr:sugar ABC transporter permease [Clostridia bacterium]